MADINVFEIEQAIHNFYHKSDDREKSHRWLSMIQQSQAAWQFSWTLISPEKSQEAQFFGATTLHSKILKYWFEVPEESIAQLRSQLLAKVLEIGSSEGGKLIATKLCLAMSSLILHTIDQHWPNAINDIITTFHSYSQMSEEIRCRLLVEILTGVADQLTGAYFGVQTGKRAAVHAKLMSEFDTIHSLLSSLLDPNVPTTVRENTLRCISSWVEFGVKIDRLGELIDKAFSCLYDMTVFEAAADTLIAAFTKNEPSQYPATLEKYCTDIVKLLPAWQRSLSEENMDWCRDISRLVINFAEENAMVLVQLITGSLEQQKLSMSVISMILTFTDVAGSFPVDETLSDLSFGFWYMLQDIILASADDMFDRYMGLFIPIYVTLVHILLRKVQYPENSVYQSMSADEKEQFRCYRQDISDTVMYANCMLRDKLLNILRSYISQISQALPNVRWQDVECLLYILSNVTEESLSTDEEDWDVTDEQITKTPCNIFDDIVVDMVNMLAKLKLDNKLLLISVLQAIGAFSEYYGHRPELLGIVFPVILLHGLGNSETALFATRALKDICKDNASAISPYSDGILNVCHHKLIEGSMTPRNAARLLSCVGYVLSTLPYANIGDWLNKFLPPITQSLTQAAAAAPSVAVKMTILDRLQMLTWLSDSLDVKRNDKQVKSSDSQPVLVIMKSLLPIINSILSNWVNEPDIVECVVELLKKSLHTLLDDYIQILPEVCTLLVKMYEYIQHFAILDIIRQLVLMFIKDSITFELVKGTFHSVAHKTLAVMQPVTEAHSRTDLLESYMNLCVQMSKKAPGIITDDNFPFDSTVEIAVIGVSFPEAPTMKASCSFLADVLSKSEKYKKLGAVIPKISTQLYDIMLKSIGGASPRANVENTSSIFLAMNVAYFDIATSTMNLLLNQPDYPVPQPTAAQKSRFIKDVLRERNNKRRLKETIANFSMICRGIAGTVYGEETALSLQFR